MGAHIYYHNPQKGILNETDKEDFMDSYADGDDVYYTERGDATLNVLTPKDILKIKKDIDGYEIKECYPE